MEMATLGKTGLEVSRLGIGLAEIGSVDYATAARVLSSALFEGINFFDTAACYGDSEEWIGRALAERRDQFILATKAGHVTGGYEGEPWTKRTILDSIERSLERMETDHVDLVQLHSCDLEVLERGEVIEALVEARDAGKTRFIGYSGDDEAAMWAVESGHFDTLQTSFNIVQQEPLRELLPKAEEREMGIIIKRPIANAMWLRTDADASGIRERYAERARQMKEMGPLPTGPEDPIALSLAFTLSHDVVDTAIVGTADADHVRENAEMVLEFPHLSDELIDELHRRFEQVAMEASSGS